MKIILRFSGPYKFTLGDPTYYRWKDAVSIKQPKYPTRQRGKSGSFLIGGIHLSYYTYLPFRLLNIISASEFNNFNHRFPKEEEGITYLLANHSLKKMEEHLHKRMTHQNNIKLPIQLLNDTKEDLSKIVYVPWFYECNKERYPAWKGEHDNRVS